VDIDYLIIAFVSRWITLSNVTLLVLAFIYLHDLHNAARAYVQLPYVGTTWIASV
jgi:hypothetical protein